VGVIPHFYFFGTFLLRPRPKAVADKAKYDRLSQLQSDFIRRFIEKITGYQVHYEEIKKGTSSDVICTVFYPILVCVSRVVQI